MGLSKKYEKDYFSLSSAKFFAEFRRVILHVISFLRNSAISSAKLCEKKRYLLDNPLPSAWGEFIKTKPYEKDPVTINPYFWLIQRQ